ncbi:MAG: PIG-L family deacetylase [Anaerolineae bacterium]|nr:PIG-L family deacetylase [Anaerolineae bacterium]
MPLTWPEVQHIYLSPHLDDAVLSCGGLIYELARRGETISVITLFSAGPSPNYPLSSYAKNLHARWQLSAPAGIDFSDPTTIRRAEDRRALALLDPAIQVIHYHLPDCIYRVDAATGETLYASEEAIFGLVHPDDPALDGLRDAPPLPENALLYLPLAIGNHVDHQVVRSVAEHWQVPLSQMRYYEDYPYVTYPDALNIALGAPASWHVITYPITEAALAAKSRAIAAYVSQISSFWDHEDAMIAALREHVQQSGGERLWIRQPR